MQNTTGALTAEVVARDTHDAATEATHQIDEHIANL